MLLLHCKYSCIVGDRSFSAAAALYMFLYCWRQVLVLLVHCKFSCIVGDRSFSTATAL
jgi:hypothetical protein